MNEKCKECELLEDCLCEECADKYMWTPNEYGICPGDLMMSSEEE